MLFSVLHNSKAVCFHTKDVSAGSKSAVSLSELTEGRLVCTCRKMSEWHWTARETLCCYNCKYSKSTPKVRSSQRYFRVFQKVTVIQKRITLGLHQVLWNMGSKKCNNNHHYMHCKLHKPAKTGLPEAIQRSAGSQKPSKPSRKE